MLKLTKNNIIVKCNYLILYETSDLNVYTNQIHIKIFLD